MLWTLTVYLSQLLSKCKCTDVWCYGHGKNRLQSFHSVIRVIQSAELTIFDENFNTNGTRNFNNMTMVCMLSLIHI